MPESSVAMDWNTASGLRPSVAPHIFWAKQSQRGVTWYVLQNEATGDHARFNASAHAIISRLDGKRTLGSIASEVQSLGFAHCDPDRVLELMQKLQRVGALREDHFIATETLRTEYQQSRRKGYLKQWLNPLAVRVNLFDPDELLSRITPKLSLLFNTATAWIWLIVFVLAFFALMTGWSEISEEFLTRTMRVQTLWWFALLYPLLKFVHELAHAVCVKQWGGQVRNSGISLLLLVPVPFVDASDVYTQHTRKQRIIITAAGMGAEIFIAALALLFWFWVEPGYLRDALFSVFLIGGLTTVLFNANPLLKFDGYYLFQDVIDIPNLSARSSLYLNYRFKHHVLGLSEGMKPYASKRESVWLLVYGVGVILYKPILTLTIIGFLWKAYPWLGMVLAVFALFNQWLVPTVRAVRWLFASSELEGQRSRAIALVFCFVCALTTVLLVPMPSTTRVQGVVAASEQGEVFAESNGIISVVHVKPGKNVVAGEKLITLENVSLQRDLQRVEAELSALRSERMVGLHKKSGVVVRDHSTTTAEQKRLQANLQELIRKRNALTVKATRSGIFAPLESTVLAGRHIEQGERIGFVIDGQDWTIRTLIPEARAAQLRAGVRNATVRLVEAIDHEIPVTLLRETPAVTRQLPSAALSQFGGGTIVTDPFDTTHQTALKNQFELELNLPSDTAVVGLGQRALVRLEHPAEALLTRLWRATRSVWLTRTQA